MTFEQTKVYYTLLKHFTDTAIKNRYTAGREAIAADMVTSYSRMHGSDNIRKVARKANQKARYKFYTVQPHLTAETKNTII